MNKFSSSLGLGLGWRPELALFIERCPDLGFVEIIAESVDPWSELPAPLVRLRRAGRAIVPHGIGLSLGGAEPLDERRVEWLACLAKVVDAPLVSEHIAFVRAGGVESGHLLPVPRTRAALQVLVENVRRAQALLNVPLALENIASFVEWPDAEMDEVEFVSLLLERTDALLLLDLANLHANARNLGWDALAYLERLPYERLAYVHVAGGVERDGLYHDSHAHAVSAEVNDLVAKLSARTTIPGVLLERDDHFPTDAELRAELRCLHRAAFGTREAQHVR